MPKLIVGIDPDVDSSGMGIVTSADGVVSVEVRSLRFPQLMAYVLGLRREGVALSVYVEAGWLNAKSCFHSAQGRGAERVAKNVGANHQVGRLIIEMLEAKGVPVHGVMPLVKCWKGPGRKITHAELVSITGLKRARTNQEERDALLLAWVWAGLPVRVRP